MCGFFVVGGEMGTAWVGGWLVLKSTCKVESVLVGHQHGVVERLSGRSARDRNGKPEVRWVEAWTDLEWIARPEVSEGAAEVG